MLMAVTCIEESLSTGGGALQWWQRWDSTAATIVAHPSSCGV